VFKRILGFLMNINYYDKQSNRYWVFIEFNLVVVKIGSKPDNLTEVNRYKIKNKSRLDLLKMLKGVKTFEEFSKVLKIFIEN
jgi:hypothetical protein